MPVSDLTGTKWVINNNPNTYGSYAAFSINFTSNNTNQTSIEFDVEMGFSILYSGTIVCYGAWNDEVYRIISITGGTDATNANLIAWLQANATQVEVTNLNGTTWEVNSSVSIVSGYGAFDLVFDGEYSDLSGIAIGYNYSSYHTGGDLVPGSSIFFLGDIDGEYDVEGATLSISGGTDVANPNLIVWLAQNATYQASPVEYPPFTFGSLPIEKMYFGDATVVKVYYGNTEIWSSTPTLAAPSISVEGSILTITDTDGNATSFDIYADGVYQVTVAKAAGAHSGGGNL